MKLKYLSVQDIILIHEDVTDSHELQGMAPGKSIAAVVNRIDNRVHFNLINDVYELAASYACCIAVGHAFNDANKRTAAKSMDVCLFLNGIDLDVETQDIGDMIIKAAQSIIHENELAQWLRDATAWNNT